MLLLTSASSQYFRRPSFDKILLNTAPVIADTCKQDILAGFYTCAGPLQLPRCPGIRELPNGPRGGWREAQGRVSELCDSLLCIRRRQRGK